MFILKCACFSRHTLHIIMTYSTAGATAAAAAAGATSITGELNHPETVLVMALNHSCRPALAMAWPVRWTVRGAKRGGCKRSEWGGVRSPTKRVEREGERGSTVNKHAWD